MVICFKILPVHRPIKQGLKHFATALQKFEGVLPVHRPIKQGLKQDSIYFLFVVYRSSCSPSNKTRIETSKTKR